MQREWWVSIIQWSLWGLVMAVVMGWVARSRLRTRPENESKTLRHPVSTLAIGVVGATFFFGIAVVSNTVGKNSTSTVWTTLVFVFFGAMSLPMVADYFFARHSVTESGINYGRMLGQRGVLAWADVKSVRYAPVMKWFVLKPSNGIPVRVSAMLMGLPEFATQLLAHVPEDRIDAQTLDVLRQTSAGKPPNVWG
jgi:predicted permease